MSDTQTRSAPSQLLSLPAQLITEEVLLEKYAKGEERTADDIRRRVARALAQAEAPEQRAHWEARFLDAQQRGFVPAGRISSAAGTTLSATLINCFVQPVGDSIASIEDGHPGHLHRADRGGRDDAPRRRRGLRLLAHPPERRLGRQHAVAMPRGR